MKKIIFLFFLFTICSGIPGKNNNEAQYIWYHNELNARNEYVYFRNDFIIDSEIKSGEINIFVDSRYQLFVNEIFLGFGPARSYPQNPQFDTYDIKNYLKKGENVISVKALYNGIENFQVPDNRPGFIAWGTVECDGMVFSLNSKGSWLCRKSEGYDQEAVRFSFACGAMEVYDGTKELYDWKSLDTDLTKWIEPIVIENKNYWGELNPRNIPHLSSDEILAKNLVSVFDFNNDEDIYQFRIKTPDEKRSDYYPPRQCLAYTYIYSPKEQDVKAGLWWGEFFLNGKGPLEGLGENPKRPNRNPRVLRLKKGWNFFNFYYGAIWGAWDFYMSVPKSAGLELSPGKERSDDISFMTSGYHEGEFSDFIAENKKGFSSAEEFEEFFNTDWMKRYRYEKTNNPALDMVWNLAEKEVRTHPWKTTGIKIPGNQSTALTFDIGGKTLGKYFIEVEAPSGTVIDIGISEDLFEKKPWLFKRKMISAASRFITNGIVKRYETFKPYGFRYLQVNVFNNEEPVIIKKVGSVKQVYPFEKIGKFECSDPIFNSIWELGWRTLRVCAEDTYTDTPFRERGLYAGDMLPEYAITLSGTNDSRLLKRSLKVFYDKYFDVMFGDQIPAASEFPLINILSTKWYFDITDDLELIEYVYPGYKALLKRWLSTADENGLMFLGRQFIEWTKIDKYAKLTATHSLLAHCFRIMSDFAERLERNSDKLFFAGKASDLEDKVQKMFWDNDRSLFNDGYQDGKLEGKFYPTSNSWPLLFNCTDKYQDEKIIDYLEKELSDIGEESRNRRITPYGSFYTIAVLYQLQRPDIAEKFIKKYWTRMILNGDDTSWENFDIGGEHEGGGQGTASHAWSGHPTYFLSTEVLGVSLGFHKEFDRQIIKISPQTETISWAKGVVPHPAGPIKVEWKIKGDNLFVNYEAPNSLEVQISPLGRLADKIIHINEPDF